MLFSSLGVLMYAILLITIGVIINLYVSFEPESDDEWLPIRNRKPGIPVKHLAGLGEKP